MIVKVQKSLNDGKLMLVYDETRSWYYQGPMTKTVRAILAGRKKAYFHAQRTGTVLHIEAAAPEQDW